MLSTPRHRLAMFRLISLVVPVLLMLWPIPAAADPNPIASVGIYNCYSGMPPDAIPFFKACGYNTYQRWDLGWTLRPSSLDRYYTDMAEDVRRMQAAGFKAYVLLTTNMIQRQEGEPEGYRTTAFDPGNHLAMQERLARIAGMVRKLKTADGFTICPGDPGGHDAATPAQLHAMVKQIVRVIREEAPKAHINVNAWGISTWDHNPSPFTVEFWEKEVAMTDALIAQPGMFGPDVGVEFPMHNYYRSLALTCYDKAGRQPALCPSADQVATLEQRGVTRRWGWPYFLVDECDDGYRPGTAGQTQAETRFISKTIGRARQLGLNGVVANAMAENIFAESLNLYAFGRCANDPSATPEQVIDEFARFLAEPQSVADLAQVIRFLENQSTWQAGLPERHREPNFDVGPLDSPAKAYDQLNRVALREKCGLPELPGSPAAYVQKMKQRFRVLGGDTIPGDAGGAGTITKPADKAEAEATEGFRSVGFYLHAGWVYRHPFAVRSWSPNDYAGMFRLLKGFGYDRVMMWPVVEAIPMPLSDADRASLVAFRDTIDAARTAGLEAWFVQAANLTTDPSVAAKPWRDRVFPAGAKTIRLDNAAQAEPWLAHRATMMAILNNADAYVTIDGDPGGYAKADPQDWVKVFRADQATIAAHGTHPDRQKVIPWLWCGWGTKGVWAEPIRPFLDAELAAIKEGLSGDWELLPGRSHREGWANGRLPVQATVDAGLLDRSTIFCYEAIEFEPSIPQAKLQFDLIRANLAEEGRLAGTVRGVFGNAQQPLMVLPNIWFFAQAARNPAYRSASDEQILRDLAEALGGPAELLVPAWQCMTLPLDRLPADLPAALRRAKLASPLAASLPGGPQRYLEILAAQVESQRRILVATSQPPADGADAAARMTEALAAVAQWWDQHGYVGGAGGGRVAWNVVPDRQRELVAAWAKTLDAGQVAAIRAAAPEATQHLLEGILPR